MKYEWKEVRLGDICKTNASSYSNKENWEYINYLDTGNITQNKIDNIVHLNCETDKIPSRAKRKVKDGDIIYSNVRPNQLHYGLMKNIPSNFLVSTGFTTISVNEDLADNKFIYYYIIQESITQKLQNIAEQSVSAYPSIKPSDLEELTIKIPVKVSEQKAISSILSALDDKIALNQQINNNLEQQTQAIFKSWFVDFEPFKDEDFIDSELGQIPKGWRVGTLSEIIDITSGKRPQVKSQFKEHDMNIPIIGASSIMGYTNKYLYNEKILIIGRVGTLGVVQKFNGFCWTSDNTLVIKSKYYEFAYQNLLKIDYSSINRGSTQPLITQTDLNNIKIVISKDIVLEKFEKLINPINDMIESNKKEILKLSCLRDTLLPKLMSGEIDVSDITTSDI